MSHSELLEFEDLPADLAAAMRALGERFGLRRVCVHADGWSAAATLDDPDSEHEALLVGNLLAATRASLGHPARPTAIDPAATFEEPPFRLGASGPWHLVGCSPP
jgi:ADP-dependent phosphofructokinase/glucokinase